MQKTVRMVELCITAEVTKTCNWWKIQKHWIQAVSLFFRMQAEFVWHKLSADNMDPDFVERRRVGLENFLLRVASHPVLSNDKILYHFLTEVHAAPLGQSSSLSDHLLIELMDWITFHCCVWQEHGWKEVVYETGFQAKVLDICVASISLLLQTFHAEIFRCLTTSCCSYCRQIPGWELSVPPSGWEIQISKLR